MTTTTTEPQHAGWCDRNHDEDETCWLVLAGEQGDVAVGLMHPTFAADETPDTLAIEAYGNCIETLDAVPSTLDVWSRVFAEAAERLRTIGQRTETSEATGCSQGWCVDPKCKDREHSGRLVSVPATGGTHARWLLEDEPEGAGLPMVRLMALYSTIEGDADDAPWISLEAFDGRSHQDVQLRLSEAEQLARCLPAMVQQVRGGER